MKDKYSKLLKNIYEEAGKIGLGDIHGLDNEDKKRLNAIVSKSDSQKGVYVVLIVSLATKIIDPKQDVRKHQANMKGGYSGRSVDTRYVTPFLKSIKLPTNKESGWLTRSLEQNYPYNLDYRGKIRDIYVKNAFLRILDNIESKGKPAEKYLLYLFKLSLIEREKRNIKIIKPSGRGGDLTIDDTIYLLYKHFNNKYSARGASRLPVLAIYSIYQCIIGEAERFKGKILVPLEEHTSADVRSGAIADVEIKNQDGSYYEAVEVKHRVSITPGIVSDAYKKFASHPVNRYYLLTTAVPSVKKEDQGVMRKLLREIKTDHGCQVIVNGIMPSLNYYLRLIKDINEFIIFYTNNISSDSSIGLEHKTYWNKIVKELKRDH